VEPAWVQAAIDLPAPDPEIVNNARLNVGDNLISLGQFDEAVEQYGMVETVILLRRPEDRLSRHR
jgi:hypothetical protein